MLSHAPSLSNSEYLHKRDSCKSNFRILASHPHDIYALICLKMLFFPFQNKLLNAQYYDVPGLVWLKHPSATLLPHK